MNAKPETLDAKYITLAHGNGGRLMRELIERVFAPHLANTLLDVQADAVPLPPVTAQICPGFVG